MPRAASIAVAAVLLLGVGSASVRAHDLEETTVAVVLRADGAALVEVTADLDALLLGAGSGHDAAELVARIAALPEAEREASVDRLRALFQRRVRLRFDGQPVPFDVSFPDRRAGAVSSGGEEAPSWLGLRVRLSARAPGDWRRFSFWASRAFQAVRLTVVELASGRTAVHELEVGEESPAFERGSGGADG